MVITLAFLGHGSAYLLSIKELPVNLKSMWDSGAKSLSQLQTKLKNWAEDELPVVRLFDSSLEAEKKSLEEPVLHERRRFLLICFTILGLITFWMWRLFIIWICGGGRNALAELIWIIVLILFLLAVVAGFLFTAVDRATWARRFRAPSASKSDSTKKPRGHSVHHFYVTTMTSVLMAVPAIFAGWALCRVLMGAGELPQIYDKLLLMRTLSPANGVSQAIVVLFIAAAVYIWACWNVSQLSMRGDYYEADWGLFRLLGGESVLGPRPDAETKKYQSSEPLKLELTAILASPWRRTRPWLLAGVLLTVGIYALFAWGDGYGIDGVHFSKFVWWATLLAVFVFAHSVSQTIHLSILLGQMLRNLGTHPLASAFKRIAEQSLFDWRLPVRPSRARQLLPALNLAQSIMTPFRKSEDSWVKSAAESIREKPEKAFLRNEAWEKLVAFGSRVQEMLERGPWQPSGQDNNPKRTEKGENLLALLLSFVIRDTLSRLVGGFAVALTMAILICGAHMFYSFQGRHLFVWLDLSIIAVLVLIGAATLLHFDKDKVLSLSWSTTPGRINWTGSLMYRTVIGVAISLLAILAARFPELGMNLTSWMAPLRNLP